MLILPEFAFYLFDFGWEVRPESIGMTLDAKQSYWNSMNIESKRKECRQMSAIPSPAEFERYFNL